MIIGGWSKRVEEPGGTDPALKRAREVAADGKAALLEFVTSREHVYSRFGE